jgi:hypothetical protein
MIRWRTVATVTVPALAFVVALLAIGTELWVRVRWDSRKGTPGFFLSDPVRGQRLAANYDGWFAGVPVKLNRLELRDSREYDLAKRPNTFRILVLGDSVTFGHGSVYEHTYPYLLEQQLKAWRTDVDWQVWNAAVPGYNSSQELAHLEEVGPRFAPDLVVVGFFENDVIDNHPPTRPSFVRTAVSNLLSFGRRHLYSLDWYAKTYFRLAWKFSSSDEYRLRIEHLADQEQLLAAAKDATTLQAQQLTPFDRLSDEEVRHVDCVYGMKPNPTIIPSIRKESGFDVWLQAIQGFQRLNQAGAYRIVFFLNVVPPSCPDGDVFYDGGSSSINRFYLDIMSRGTPAVSAYDAFLHVRPSQMPAAAAHSIGNSNLVKAEVLFNFLRDRVLGPLVPAVQASPSRTVP